MPFTAFHLVAGFGVKAIAPQRINYAAFAIVNIVIDLETLLLLSFEDLFDRVHGTFHSLIFATFLAFIVAGCMRRPSTVWLSTALGAWTHVFLDALYHPDVAIFLPYSAWSPIYGYVEPGIIEYGCLAFGLVLPPILWKYRHPTGGLKEAWHTRLGLVDAKGL